MHLFDLLVGFLDFLIVLAVIDDELARGDDEQGCHIDFEGGLGFVEEGDGARHGLIGLVGGVAPVEAGLDRVVV